MRRSDEECHRGLDRTRGDGSSVPEGRSLTTPPSGRLQHAQTWWQANDVWSGPGGWPAGRAVCVAIEHDKQAVHATGRYSRSQNRGGGGGQQSRIGVYTRTTLVDGPAGLRGERQGGGAAGGGAARWGLQRRAVGTGGGLLAGAGGAPGGPGGSRAVGRAIKGAERWAAAVVHQPQPQPAT